MSDEPPRSCRDCVGKFRLGAGGEICEVCRLTLRIRQHLLSPRYPAEGGEGAVVVLRECLWRLLEHSDSHWGAKEAALFVKEKGKGKGIEDTPREASPGKVEEERAKKEPLEEPATVPIKVEPTRSHTPELPGLCGKAPPVKPPREVEAASSGAPSPRIEGKKKVSKSRGRRRERHHRDRSQADKKGKRRTRSRSRRKAKKVDRPATPPLEEESPSRGEEESEEEESLEERARPSSAGDRRQARSPPYPPRNYSRPEDCPKPWPGPILAKRKPSQTDYPARWPSSKPKHKGEKKRRQQERAKQFGGWNHRDRPRKWR